MKLFTAIKNISLGTLVLFTSCLLPFGVNASTATLKDHVPLVFNQALIGAKVTLPESKISFNIPKGWTLVSKKSTGAFFNAIKPEPISNGTYTPLGLVLVVNSTKEKSLSDLVQNLKKSTTSQFKGARLLDEGKVKTLSGVSGYFLDYSYPSLFGNLRNEFLVTLKGHTQYRVSFTAPTALYASRGYRMIFQSTIKTLQIP